MRLTYQEATQSLLALTKVDKLSERVRRHGEFDLKRQTSYYLCHHGLDGMQPIQGELVGTLHVVTCWSEKGHKKGVSIPHLQQLTFI